jgi:hypothetical protein
MIRVSRRTMEIGAAVAEARQRGTSWKELIARYHLCRTTLYMMAKLAGEHQRACQDTKSMELASLATNSSRG